MEHEFSLSETQKLWHGSFKAYMIGFVSALVLTGASFLLAVSHVLSGKALVFTLVGLGLAQAITQLLFFLHLGKEGKPHWETLVLAFMILVLLIIAVGSLWIMYDLNSRVMGGM